jgi:hypothetical protein
MQSFCNSQMYSKRRRTFAREWNASGLAIHLISSCPLTHPDVKRSLDQYVLASKEKKATAAATIAASATPAITPTQKANSYSKRWTCEIWAPELSKYYVACLEIPGLSMQSFCDSQMYSKRRVCFSREWNVSGLASHLISSCPLTHPDVKRSLDQYVLASKEKKEAAKEKKEGRKEAAC